MKMTIQKDHLMRENCWTPAADFVFKKVFCTGQKSAQPSNDGLIYCSFYCYAEIRGRTFDRCKDATEIPHARSGDGADGCRNRTAT